MPPMHTPMLVAPRRGKGFWRDFGHGFVQGIKGTADVAGKLAPIIVPLAIGAGVKKRKGRKPGPKKGKKKH